MKRWLTLALLSGALSLFTMTAGCHHHGHWDHGGHGGHDVFDFDHDGHGGGHSPPGHRKHH